MKVGAIQYVTALLECFSTNNSTLTEHLQINLTEYMENYNEVSKCSLIQIMLQNAMAKR